jgi:hypothetical protein
MFIFLLYSMRPVSKNSLMQWYVVSKFEFIPCRDQIQIKPLLESMETIMNTAEVNKCGNSKKLNSWSKNNSLGPRGQQILSNTYKLSKDMQ